MTDAQPTPITSEDEIHPMLVVTLRSCAACAGDHERALILREVPGHCDETPVAHRAWVISGCCFPVACFSHSAIPEGRLFSHGDLPTIPNRSDAQSVSTEVKSNG